MSWTYEQCVCGYKPGPGEGSIREPVDGKCQCNVCQGRPHPGTPHSTYCYEQKMQALAREAIAADHAADKKAAEEEAAKSHTEETWGKHRTCVCGYQNLNPNYMFQFPKDGKCICDDCTGSSHPPYSHSRQPHAKYCYEQKMQALAREAIAADHAADKKAAEEEAASVQKAIDSTVRRQCVCGFVERPDWLFRPPEDGKCQCGFCRGDTSLKINLDCNPHAFHCSQKAAAEEEAARKAAEAKWDRWLQAPIDTSPEAIKENAKRTGLWPFPDDREDQVGISLQKIIDSALEVAIEKNARIKELEAEKEADKKQIDALLENVKDREMTIESYRASDSTLKGKIRELEKENEMIRQSFNDVGSENATLISCLAEKAARVKELEADLERKTRYNEEYIRKNSEYRDIIQTYHGQISNLTAVNNELIEAKAKMQQEILNLTAELAKSVADRNEERRQTFKLTTCECGWVIRPYQDNPMKNGKCNCANCCESTDVYLGEHAAFCRQKKEERARHDKLVNDLTNAVKERDERIVELTKQVEELNKPPFFSRSELPCYVYGVDELAKTEALLDIATTEIKAKQAEVDQLRAEADGYEHEQKRLKAKNGRLFAKLEKAKADLKFTEEGVEGFAQQRDEAIKERDFYKNRQILFTRYRKYLIRAFYKRIQTLLPTASTCSKISESDIKLIEALLRKFPELRQKVLKKLVNNLEANGLFYTWSQNSNFAATNSIAMGKQIQALIDGAEHSPASGSTA